MRSKTRKLPKARKEGLVVQELPGEVLVYDLDRHKAHCLNRTAALIWKNCNGHRTAAEIAELLRKEINEPADESVVICGVDQLEKAKLVVTSEAASARNRLSRREAMRRIGLAAVVALPIVTSIVAPRAAEAGTCRASGQPCTSSLQCCSGLCANGSCA